MDERGKETCAGGAQLFTSASSLFFFHFGKTWGKQKHASRIMFCALKCFEGDFGCFFLLFWAILIKIIKTMILERNCVYLEYTEDQANERAIEASVQVRARRASESVRKKEETSIFSFTHPLPLAFDYETRLRTSIRLSNSKAVTRPQSPLLRVADQQIRRLLEQDWCDSLFGVTDKSRELDFKSRTTRSPICRSLLSAIQSG